MSTLDIVTAQSAAIEPEATTLAFPIGEDDETGTVYQLFLGLAPTAGGIA